MTVQQETRQCLDSGLLFVFILFFSKCLYHNHKIILYLQIKIKLDGPTIVYYFILNIFSF